MGSASSSFYEAKMENQIDRATVLADKPSFAKWLLHRTATSTDLGHARTGHSTSSEISGPRAPVSVAPTAA